jgi:hypothetical protein
MIGWHRNFPKQREISLEAIAPGPIVTCPVCMDEMEAAFDEFYAEDIAKAWFAMQQYQLL